MKSDFSEEHMVSVPQGTHVTIARNELSRDGDKKEGIQEI